MTSLQPRRYTLTSFAAGRRRVLPAALAATLLLVTPVQAHAARPSSQQYCASSGAGADDTCYGASALALESGGNYNSAFGNAALSSNSTGYDNTGAGSGALGNNSTGFLNTAVGGSALYNNTTGSANTALGVSALASNVTASNSTAVGSYALENNTAAAETATGHYALYANTTGTDNTADGFQALQSNTTATDNTATGYEALTANTGSANTADGSGALVSNTSGSSNTAAGVAALDNNTTGFYNVATGFWSLIDNSTGSQNTADGVFALGFTTTGNNDTALGYGAGLTGNSSNADTTGSNNTFIGYNSGPGTSTQLTNATAIGENALVSESNALALGGTGADAVNVGIGTATPDQALTVAGSIHLSGTGNKLIFPDGTTQTTAATLTVSPGPAGTYLRSNGTSWTSSAIQAGDLPAGSTNYIQNGTSQQASANFNISGNGTLGGSLSVAPGGGSGTLFQAGKASTSYGSYVQVPLVTNASAPPAADCNNSTFVGRLVLQVSSKATSLWACNSSGKWVVTK
ncbi:MAG TPA: hypothetical protein VKX16_14135 [Chloroflexota bacterium]|nr:hypothetical protein [Chloroflexota bacterium]